MIQFAPELVVLLLCGFQFKHFVFDGPLQSHAMVVAKGYYGKPLGLLHAALHGVGSMLLVWVLSQSVFVGLVLGVLDSVVHYHIDFSKERIVRGQGWTSESKYFWWALSLDQALHQLTYLAIVYALL